MSSEDVLQQFTVEITEFIQDAIKPPLGPEIEAIIITGSHARGDYTLYSDLDFTYLLSREPHATENEHELVYIGHQLVTITRVNFRKWEHSLISFENFMWTRSAFEYAIVCYDKSGKFGKLRQTAAARKLEDFYEERIDLVNKNMKGYVEEIHKLLNGLTLKNKSTIYNALVGLNAGMCNVIAYAYGITPASENHFNDDIQASILVNSDYGKQWIDLWERVNGIHHSDIFERARYGIQLFLVTKSVVDGFLKKDTQAFLIKAIELVAGVDANLVLL